MTSVDREERFSSMHYLVPALFFVFLFLFPFFSPLNIRFQNFNNQIIIDPTYGDSSVGVYVLAVFRRCYMAFYGLLCLPRLQRFRLAENAQPDKNKWLWMLCGMYGIIFLFTFLRLFDYDKLWPVTVYTVIVAVLLVVMQTMICFNVLSGNFRLARMPDAELPGVVTRKYTQFQQTRFKTYDRKKVRVSTVIDRSEFENYFRLKKPYLNPKLTIDDLVETFNACRSIISSFVNKTYGVSFSWYVNYWRLCEVNRLMNSRRYKSKDMDELVLKAGFGSYRTYLRAKAYFKDNKITEGWDLRIY